MPPMRPEELRTLAEHLLPPAQLREFVEMREADFAINVPGIGRFRANVHYQRGTLAASIRLLPSRIPSLESLHGAAR